MLCLVVHALWNVHPSFLLLLNTTHQALKEDPEKGDADTLINLLATAQHLHKPPETTQRLLAYVPSRWRGSVCR